ncbi:MlaD family protein [Sulfurimonas autotrophica]|uniref:Mammalian cell entry related domain protein n=1 Tax=Sulfurimonas autotrophica (strain ATCC BAA-671 / DSM 16294 / JCM 11897 / OK10) TaxID=563040 RepID=E0UQ03_SULAO|nr:MlaD family protein [Sulfurimonas autotrophica]ADN08678.1 Mammalian cell entry related domain protein [Sulfurimonas autotrophica DSM 16294]
MNNKVNYTFIGLIVLLGIVSMLGFTYWMLKPAKAEETQKYIIYFNESVLGLNLNAPVKYRGIKVGKVTRLRINPNNSEQVEVTVQILKTTPIKEDTVAKLTAQGITGLSYINLTEGSNHAPPLKIKEGQSCPVIKSAPSFFANVEQSLDSVSELLLLTLGRTNQLLNDGNQKQFSKLLAKSALVMAKVDSILDEKTMAHIQKSAENLDRLTLKIDESVPNINKFVNKSIEWENKINKSFTSIKETYLHMGIIMNNMAKSFLHVEENVEDATVQTLPLMNSTMLEMQQTLINLDELINHYERSPSDILFKKEQMKRGPGEK